MVSIIDRNSCPTRDGDLRTNTIRPAPVCNSDNFNNGYNNRINANATLFKTNMNFARKMDRECTYRSQTNKIQYFRTQNKLIENESVPLQCREHQDFRRQNVPWNSNHPKSTYDSRDYQQNEVWSYHSDERSNVYWDQEYYDYVPEPPQQNFVTSLHKGIPRPDFRPHNEFTNQSYEWTAIGNNYRLNNNLLNMPINFGVDRGVKRKLSNRENVPHLHNNKICRNMPNDFQQNPRLQARMIPSKTVTSAPSLTEIVKNSESPPNSQIDVQAILSKLSAYGIIQKCKTNDAKSPPKSKKIVGKISMMDFDPKKLRIKHEKLIDKLNAGICCSTCGLCFSSNFGEEEEARLRYKIHIEKHFKNNLKKADMAQCSREYFSSLNEWFSHEVISDMRRPLEEKVEQDSHISTSQDKTKSDDIKEVYDDKRNKGPIKKSSILDPICNVCQEDFDDVWDAEEEDWIWKDMCIHDDKAFHSICFADFKKVSKIVAVFYFFIIPRINTNPYFIFSIFQHDLDEHCNKKQKVII